MRMKHRDDRPLCISLLCPIPSAYRLSAQPALLLVPRVPIRFVALVALTTHILTLHFLLLNSLPFTTSPIPGSTR